MKSDRSLLTDGARRVLRTAFFCMCLLLWPVARAQYFDESASTSAEDYLQQVSDKLGDAALGKIPRGQALYLAGTFGRLDRLSVSPEVFIEHLQYAISLRNRFYADIPEESFRKSVLPIRIRAELTTRAGWRKLLNTELTPVIGKETDAGRAAKLVLAWVRTKVKLTEEARTYPLNLKGDLDPLTTLRGGRGNEIDISIFAVACLRSVGIAARIVYAPVIANEKGGKVWMEYRDSKGWQPWVPSLPEGINTRVALNRAFAGKWAYIIANPDQPVNITPSYTPATPLWLCSNPLTVEKFDGTAMIVSNGRMQPVMGRDIYNVEPENANQGLGQGAYIVVSGDRATLGGIKPITLQVGKQGWYQMDFEAKKQQFALSKEQPPFFEWVPENGEVASDW